MSAPFVMWGATGQAKVLRELLAARYRLIALFDNDRAAMSPFEGVPIFHGKDGFERWRRETPGDVAFAVAIGGNRGLDRLELQRFLESRGLTPLTAVHERAYVAGGVSLGKGCQILALACVGADARLGDACIVNTGAIVDHECTLGDGAHIGPGATLAGCVAVGECAFVGAGAVVLPRRRIGRSAVVGAGAVVVEHVAEGAVVAGNPAHALAGSQAPERRAR